MQLDDDGAGWDVVAPRARINGYWMNDRDVLAWISMLLSNDILGHRVVRTVLKNEATGPEE